MAIDKYWKAGKYTCQSDKEQGLGQFSFPHADRTIVLRTTSATELDKYTDIRNTKNTQRKKATCTPSKARVIVICERYYFRD